MQADLTRAMRELRGSSDAFLASRVLEEDSEVATAVSHALRIQAAADEVVRAVVQEARDRGVTWQAIGDSLGVSRQAAFQRYGKPIDPRTGDLMNTTPLADAAELARAVIEDLVAGRWDSITAQFDSTMRTGLPADALAAAWAQIVGASGAFEAHGEPAVSRMGDITVVNTPLSMEAGDYTARIAFRDDKTIAGLHILTKQNS